MTDERPWAERNGALLAFGAALVLFVCSASPVVHWGDSAELSRRALDLDLSPVARGYPLHRLLTWAAGKATGDAAYGSNLVSALFGAISVALVYETGRRLGRSAWAGAAAAATTAFAHTFWSYSAVAEVYTLHTALMLGAILLAVAADSGGVWTRRALGLVLGIAMLHHRMIAFVAPGLVFWMWTGTGGRERLRAALHVFQGLVAGLVPFAVLCAVASRSPPAGETHAVRWWFEDVFLGGETNAGFLLGAGRKAFGQSALYLARFVAFNLAGPALVLCVHGFAVAGRRIAIFLGILTLAHLWFPLRYDWTGDQYTFLIPLYPILALAVGMSVGRIAERRGARAAGIATAAVAIVPLALYVGLAETGLGARVLPGLTADAARATLLPARHGDRFPQEWCEKRLVALPPGARLHCDWGDGEIYLYLQRAHGVRPDVGIDVWIGTIGLGDGSGEEWVSALPFTRELPRAVAAVKDRLEPRGDGLFRVRPR